ncbi:MAG: acetyl-CoA carboxylase biotin carboxylase subunit [Candidatus Omnitrophica bacterium CG07_land_8_20_14_0_80_50_8]|nr:MAG: acetyl-CoA carboxylase biotin carboxylase subunit [Candidatus Omnitrophica bacterium CG1_02_49_16]PIU40373.1 MAG: acetyl-CoA carboxylase biotin carboxylase subunit [Candidatus Omnitrophica bacterium CG07_land_8_20_14_0_80_50_8]
MFSKILVANRGEIALRVIRACKEMGVRTVAVYSEPDTDSPHVHLADEAVCIGPAPSAQSYLNIPAIISAAEITDVDAIHPGYGFLAENAHFAEICESCQIKFIGPSPQAIHSMGDKMAARELMRKVGVPIVAGTQEAVKGKEDALQIAKKIKYPVIIKATSGGGGRGMRVCHNDVRLVSALMTAQTEAEAAFGNPAVYIEKYLEKPKHIEFQILADTHGHTVHLYERDCTIQRRHQKLLEESPSPAIDWKLRKRMGDMALKAARAVNYVSAGTVEFLLDEDGRFYFMEMNTRVQVEHGITELVTGIDIVKEQIRIAVGEKLSIRHQDKIPLRGHAIECRINAEDPANNFSPSPGKIERYNVPGGPGVRMDTHAYSGYKVLPFYDSLIGKLMVVGRNRGEAISIMQRALDEFVIEPIKTTIPLHKEILKNPIFRRGQMHTDFIQRIMGEWSDKNTEESGTTSASEKEK